MFGVTDENATLKLQNFIHEVHLRQFIKAVDKILTEMQTTNPTNHKENDE